MNTGHCLVIYEKRSLIIRVKEPPWHVCAPGDEFSQGPCTIRQQSFV